MKIGVLALQGGFACHRAMLHRLGVESLEVRKEEELNQCAGLIIPGGESTTMHHLLQAQNLYAPLHRFIEKRPLFGTCAGMILMAKEGILNIAIERNAYGRQVASFTTPITLLPLQQQVEATFIRAPRIKALLSKEIEILALFQGDPIFIRQGIHYAASFHPELTDHTVVHQMFLETVSRCQATE